MPCSMVGPSSLFQRWNLQVRSLYQLVARSDNKVISKNSPPIGRDTAESVITIRVLLIVRRADASRGDKYVSRVFKNEDEMIPSISKHTYSFAGSAQLELISQDLSALSFEDQIRLISSVHIVVGMHGAGIASTMHMAIGTPNCCGVVEIFPQGEFMPIRGYGNMARRMGHHYQRIDLPNGNGGASLVPVQFVIDALEDVYKKIRSQPSCVLPSVIDDPYFL